MERIKARPFSKDTPFRKNIPVYFAASKEALSFAQELAGETVVLLEDPDPSLLRKADGPVILLGNLSNNRCVKELYYQHLLFTDRTYPGPGGYELRTLLDPFAAGFNILHIGYSDSEGLEKAAASFKQKQTKEGLPYLCEIRAAQYPFDPILAESLKEQICDPKDPTAYYTAPIDQKGFAAYFTGDEALRKEYNAAWPIILSQDNNEDLHLKLKTRVSAWRLMEMTGMLDDDLREEAENLFYRWVESREGLARIDEPVYLLPGYPRQNHGLLPAMGIRWLADFFLRYHPELERPRSWKEIADRVFSVYQDGSWKPICDGLCHGWSMSQPVMAEYGLYDEKHGYFASGGARKAAECAIAVVNNEGWMPSSGDSTLKRGFQGTLLAAAAEYYQDGRYLFVRNMAPFWRQGNLDWTSYLFRSFDIGLEPVLPEDHIGVRVIPMDPLVYHAWDAFPDRSELVVASTRPPEVPLEKCFDRLTYRSGFDTQDEYLLIDGLGGGSHSYDDAMSIVDYEKFGVDFVVAEDDLVNNETENHSMVTIIRNGECKKVPSFPALEEVRQEPDGSVYLSMILKNCSGTDWKREIYRIPEVGLVIQDTVTAQEKALYRITSRLRTPGRATLKGNNLLSRRTNGNGETVWFQTASAVSAPCRFSAVEKPLASAPPRSEKKQEPDRFSRIQNRYFFDQRYRLEEDEFCLTSYEQEMILDLQPGETVRFTNLLCPSKEPVSTKLFSRNGKIWATAGNREFSTPFAAYPFWQEMEKPAYSFPPASLTTRFDADVTCLKALNNGRIAVGLKSGQLFLRNPNGEWTEAAKTTGEVHDVLFSDGALFAAFGECGLARFDTNGNLLWQKEIQRVATVYPWWELHTPVPLTLRLVRYHGREVLAAGCGDDSLKFFDFDGTLLESFYYYIGVPDQIELFDINEDGVNEMVAGGGCLACRSNVRILNDRLETLYEFGSEGWTSHVTCLRCFSINGSPAVAMGVNHRNNLKLFQFENGKEICRINQAVAGAVTDAVYLPNAELLVGCTKGKAVLAYDLNGKQRWIQYCESGLIRLLERPEGVLAVSESGELTLFSAAGEILNRWNTGRPIQRVAETEKFLFFLCGQELWMLLL